MDHGDEMEVDGDVPTALPSLSNTHPSPHASSSSAERRPKQNISPTKLTPLNTTMNVQSDDNMWQSHIGNSKEDELRLFSSVLFTLTRVLLVFSKDLDIIPPIQTPTQADEMISQFSDDELIEWKEGTRKGLEEGNWGELINHPKLRATISPSTSEDSKPATSRHPRPEDLQEIATEKSWLLPFRGDAAKALWEHIENHFQTSEWKSYLAIIQSSGMGKSRVTDELAKEHFMIPINLREAASTGYPPADHEVRNYLTNATSRNKAYGRSCAFLEALFTHTVTVLKSFPLGSYLETAAMFRHHMNGGQNMSGHNNFRKGFYSQVIRKLSRKCTADSLCNAFLDLVAFLKSLPASPPSSTPMKTQSGPLVNLCFDEVHTLTVRNKASSGEWSMFDELQDSLLMMQHEPLFTLFISTTAKISQFTSAIGEDSFARGLGGGLKSIPPFTELGFDPLAQVISLDGNWNLENLTEDSYMSRLGRPLFGSRYIEGGPFVRGQIIQFAAAKLLNSTYTTNKISNDQALACLLQRLPIELNPTSNVAQANQRNQVERHMRVCLNIDTASEIMTTTSSSEPLLSEAAYFIMQKPSFNAAKALQSVMGSFAISERDRGEFLGLLLFILARDAAVGPANQFGRPMSGERWFSLSDFLYGEIFRQQVPSLLVNERSIHALQQISEDFPQAQLHFNHFIKVHENNAIDLTSLLLLQGRGAGVLLANNQTAIITFLKDSTTLTRPNAGLILTQITHGSNYSNVPQNRLFCAMDPYDLAILKQGENAVPLIKIVFALAAKSPSLNVIRYDPHSEYGAVVYEIWCAGMSPDILGPIEHQEVGVWDGLLQASYGWKELYKTTSPVSRDLRRSVNPGAALDSGHYSRWADRG